MEIVNASVSGVVVDLTEDDVLTLLACVREAREALSNSDEFRIRVGATRAEADLLWEALRGARAAIAAAASG